MCRLLSLFILCIVSLSALAEVSLGFKGEYSASVGIYVKDLNTDAVIACNDAQKALLPASVMKTVTAASAYSTMDPDFTFDTKVYYTGGIKGGVCTGNIIIESCADPTIDSENFKDRQSLCSEIFSALQSKGIKKINGDIIIEQSLSEAGCIPEWEIDDVAWSYGAGLYGFNFRDNYFKLWPATKKTVPFVPGLNITVRPSKSRNLIRGINSNNLIIEGYNTNDRSLVLNTTMNNPAEIFAFELKSYLTSNGITIGDKSLQVNDKSLLFTHHSPRLTEILNVMLVESHNLFAEGVLRQLMPGAVRKSAIEREIKIWSERGIPTSFNKILDGSGLSRADRIQPLFIGNILEWMAKSVYSDGFVALFPKAGIDGTVKSLLKDTPLEGKLALKSGSMNAVQCFAGYKLDDDGHPTHVVVIFVNAFYCDRKEVRKGIENFLLNTFNNKVIN